MKIEDLKPLRNGVLVEQEEVVQEQQTKSGIILLKSDFNLFNYDDDNAKVSAMMWKDKQNKGVVISVGDECSFVSKGDKVIYRKKTEIQFFEDIKKDCPLVSEDNILVKERDGIKMVHPNCVVVKITKESRDALFFKKIMKDDGSEIDFIIDTPAENEDERSARIFVSTGIIISVGSNIKNVKPGDIGILEYILDNDESIIIGYENEDKIIVVNAVTTRHEEDNIVYANRKIKKNQTVWKRGDYNVTSGLLGVIRNKELISVDPYVFLNHESTLISKVSAAGILYSEKQKILKREILAISEESKKRINAANGDKVLVDDFDLFDIVIDGKKISAINDIDIISNAGILEAVSKVNLAK